MKKSNNNKKKDLSGYKKYPKEEDIYNKSTEEKELDPEDISKKKSPNVDNGQPNEKNNVLTGSDLDVPGSELDDNQEDIGSEDEENNYYSLGGDNHNN